MAARSAMDVGPGILVIVALWLLRGVVASVYPPLETGGLGTAGFAVPGAAVVAGLGALILAEVLAHGLRLRQDVEAPI